MDPFSIAALLGAGASIISGLFGANASTQAANTQAAASDKALQLQASEYAQARSDAQPWLTAGNTALQQYMGELGLSKTVTAPSTTSANGTVTPGATTPFQSQFAETPNYQFDVQQGTKGVVNNLAALGMKNSGAALKALTRYTTGAANDTYQQYLDRLSGVSTGGQTTEGNLGALGVSSANSQANTIQNAGAATASGYIGASNALGAGLTGAANSYTTALGYGGGWGL